jgi:hypothetical protein
MNDHLNESVRDRIESLLARCDAIKRGSDIGHVMFDECGERHAKQVAACETAKDRGVGSNVEQQV